MAPTMVCPAITRSIYIIYIMYMLLNNYTNENPALRAWHYQLIDVSRLRPFTPSSISWVCENPALQAVSADWCLWEPCIPNHIDQLIDVCENPALQAISADQGLWDPPPKQLQLINVWEPSTPSSIRWSASVRTLHSKQYQMISVYEDPTLQPISDDRHLWGPSTPSSISFCENRPLQAVSASVRTLHAKQYQLISICEDPPLQAVSADRCLWGPSILSSIIYPFWQCPCCQTPKYFKFTYRFNIHVLVVCGDLTLIIVV